MYSCFCVDLCCINLYRLKAITRVEVFAVLLSDCIVGDVLAMTYLYIYMYIYIGMSQPTHHQLYNQRVEQRTLRHL